MNVPDNNDVIRRFLSLPPVKIDGSRDSEGEGESESESESERQKNIKPH